MSGGIVPLFTPFSPLSLQLFVTPTLLLPLFPSLVHVTVLFTHFLSVAPVMSCDWATAGDSLLGPHCKTVGLLIRTSHTLTGRWAHSMLISCCSLPARWYSPSLHLIHSLLSLLSFLQLFITPTLLLPLIPSLFRPWPRAQPCLYAPYTATGGHLLTSPPFPVRDIVLIPGPSPDFSPRLQDKIWELPGDKARLIAQHLWFAFCHCSCTRVWDQESMMS